MKVPIIAIGNSKGLRIGKDILKRYNIKDTIELILEDDQIILRPIDTPRQGWEEAFTLMNESEDDQLLIDDVFEDENIEEW